MTFQGWISLERLISRRYYSSIESRKRRIYDWRLNKGFGFKFLESYWLQIPKESQRIHWLKCCSYNNKQIKSNSLSISVYNRSSHTFLACKILLKLPSQIDLPVLKNAKYIFYICTEYTLYIHYIYLLTLHHCMNPYIQYN